MIHSIQLRDRLLSFVAIITLVTVLLSVHPPALAGIILIIGIDEYHRAMRTVSASLLLYAVNETDVVAPGVTIDKRPSYTLTSRISQIVFALLICAGATYGEHILSTVFLACCSVIIINVIVYHANRTTENAEADVKALLHAVTELLVDVFGQFYISYLFSHSLLILNAKWNDGISPSILMDAKQEIILDSPTVSNAINSKFRPLLYVIVITGIGENAAMLIGKFFGRKKLATLISPHKTIEGAWAQFIFTVIASILYCHVFPLPYFAHRDSLYCGSLIGLFAILGDLFESLFKRAVSLKDAGTLLPGVGGILDRIDGLIFCFPLFYHYTTFRASLTSE